MRLPVSLVLFIVCAGSLPAQTVQKVIDEYLQAAGGSKAIAQIRTETIAGSLTEASSGQTGSFALITKSPNRYYFEIVAGAERFVEAFNGMSAWGVAGTGVAGTGVAGTGVSASGQNMTEAARTLAGEAAKEAEASGRYWNSRLTERSKSRLTARLVGVENIRSRDAYHVHVEAGAEVVREVYFDLRTHLIVRDSTASVQMDYDDFRPVRGIQLPLRIGVQIGGHDYRVLVTRAEINASVDDSVFDFPAARGAQLPDVGELIREVARNQKTLEQVQKEYTCHLITEQRETSSKGAATVTVREFEVFHVGGGEVRHLIGKDGAPLSGDAKKKEDDRFNKEFEQRTKDAARTAADPKKQAKQDAEEEAQISDFLRAERFTNARRERFRGEEVIAVDFGPNPDYNPKKAIEGYVQKLRGVLLIDDKARDVARLEARFDDSIKVGGGMLASIEKGSAFVLEQARVNDEVWLPSYAEVHVAGRALLFVKLKVNEVDRYTDYKKFHSDSKFVAQPQ